MSDPAGYPSWLPGPQRLDELRRIDDLARRVESPVHFGGPGVVVHGAGVYDSHQQYPRTGFWAKITAQSGSTNLYNFAEAKAVGTAAVVAVTDGFTGPAGTYYAREVNGNNTVPVGAVIWLWPADDDQYHWFAYESSGGTFTGGTVGGDTTFTTNVTLNGDLIIDGVTVYNDATDTWTFPGTTIIVDGQTVYNFTTNVWSFYGCLYAYGCFHFVPYTPADITVTTNNYPTTYSGSQYEWYRLNPTGAVSLTGFADGTDGRWITLTNVNATNTITIPHDSGSSTAGNRVFTPNGGDYLIGPGESVDLRYDGTSSRWRVIENLPGGLITASGYTMNTNKLLGRGTASTGAVEEITLGTNLSFTGTTLNAAGGGTPDPPTNSIQVDGGGTFSGSADYLYTDSTKRVRQAAASDTLNAVHDFYRSRAAGGNVNDGDLIAEYNYDAKIGGADTSTARVTVSHTGGDGVIEFSTRDDPVGLILNLSMRANMLGFFGVTPVVRPAITGVRYAIPALTDLIADGALLGLWTDSTTAGTAPATSGLIAASGLTLSGPGIAGRTTGGAGAVEELASVPLSLGGTGQTTAVAAFDALAPTTTQGDLIYHDGTDNVRLAKNTTATRYLSNTGASNNPAWAQVALGDGVTGTLAIANGGTGQTTAVAAFDALAPTTTQGDTIYHNGTDNVRLAKGAAGQVYTMNSGATAPEWALPKVYEGEVDFGTLPTNSCRTTITNAAITAGSKVLLSQSNATPTGGFGEESEFDPLALTALPASGTMVVTATALDYAAVGKFKFTYLLGA